MLNQKVRDFPCGPVVKMSPSNADDAGSIPGWGIKMSQVLWAKTKQNKNKNTQNKKTKIKQKQYFNKFNKDFKKNRMLLKSTNMAL